MEHIAPRRRRGTRLAGALSFLTAIGMAACAHQAVRTEGGAQPARTSGVDAQAPPRAATPPLFMGLAGHGVATDGKDMFVTADGGETWQSVVPNRSLQGVTQLDFVSPKVGFAILPRYQEGDILLRTTDGGHTWSTVP